MKIIRPYAHLLNPRADALEFIEQCGRVSHRSGDKMTKETSVTRRFIQSVVLGHGDWSIVEHVTATVDATVDRGITHEWVRHRLFSYTQESTRFVRYSKEGEGDVINPAQFIYPKPEVECILCSAGRRLIVDNEFGFGHGGEQPHQMVSCAYEDAWLTSITQSEMSYKTLLSEGWRPQEARSVFPNALASRIIITGNLRNWRHFFIMRTTVESHPQMRQVSIPLLAEFQSAFPVLYDDIKPNARQIDNLRLPR